uniref:Aldehyde dehydrogenase domain-containing protein n=1 Tax=Aquila chrysaetos chrysaetos TaxID=223781 RepID=A0A663F352_AQUCH
MSPHAELVSRLRAAWLSGKTRPMEYRVAQLEALGRFLDEKQQDILEATAADMPTPSGCTEMG